MSASATRVPRPARAKDPGPRSASSSWEKVLLGSLAALAAAGATRYRFAGSHHWVTSLVIPVATVTVTAALARWAKTAAFRTPRFHPSRHAAFSLQDVPDALLVQDPASSYVQAANARGALLWGHTSDSFHGLTWNDLTATDHGFAPAEMARRVAEAACGRPQLFEWAARHKDGRAIPVEIHMQTTAGGLVLVAVRDIRSRRQGEENFAGLSKDFNARWGADYFPLLVSSVANTVPADYVFVAERGAAMGDYMQTVAVWSSGAAAPNLSFALSGTAAAHTVTHGLTCVASGVRTQFPQDSLLAEQSAEGYAAAPLIGRTGEVLGLLVATSRAGFESPHLALLTLRACAPRAAAELERLRTDRVVRENELAYRSVFEQTPFPVGVTTLEGVYVDVNPQFCIACGLERGDILHHTAVELGLMTEEEAERQKSALLAGGGNLTDFEGSLRTRLGEERQVLLSARTLSYRNRPLVAFIINDVTAWKKALSDRAGAMALMEAALTQSPSGIIMAEAPSGEIRVINAAALEILGGAQRGDDVHPGWHSFRPDGSVYPRDKMPMARALAGETTRNEEILIQQESGTQRWVLVNAAPIQTGGHASTGAIVMFEDITGQKRLEAERARLRDQFHAAQKMESVGRLAGGVAHDFNNLLTVINGYSQMALGEEIENECVREALSEIADAGDRAAQLIDQLLSFSRRSVRYPKTVLLNDLVGSMQRMLGRLLGEDVEVVTALQAGVGAILADPSQINQVIVNLAVNSRDAMPQGGVLRIGTAAVNVTGMCGQCGAGLPLGPYVALTVTDNGAGMPASVRDHMFEPFFTTKAPGKGTGLGLATVSGIVQQNGGHIDVSSTLGEGTTFRILFPRVDGSAATPEQPRPALAQRGRGRILIVEDQNEVRSFTARALRTTGYHVVEAKSGREALALCGRDLEPCDLLLTDVVMPGMSGVELAAALRELRPGMRVLFMTGYGAESLSERAGQASHLGLTLQKPFDAATLSAKVQEALS